MKLCHAAVLALLLFSACGQASQIAKATHDAESAATRAEEAASRAEQAAEQANIASAKLQKELAETEDAVRRANDVISRICTCPQPSVTPKNARWLNACYQRVRRTCGPD